MERQSVSLYLAKHKCMDWTLLLWLWPGLFWWCATRVTLSHQALQLFFQWTLPEMRIKTTSFQPVLRFGKLSSKIQYHQSVCWTRVFCFLRIRTGVAVTASILLAGLWSMQRGNSRLSNKLMHARVFAQGATLCKLLIECGTTLACAVRVRARSIAFVTRTLKPQVQLYFLSTVATKRRRHNKQQLHRFHHLVSNA
jgi:hypothetical protein